MTYTTKKSLLEAIRNGDEVSWHEFYDTYRPLIILRGTDYQLNTAELEDLVQLVLLDIFKSGKSFHYDRSQGRFRDYLRKIISHNAVDLIRKRRDEELGDVDLTEFIDERQDDRWLTEWQSHIMSQSLVQLRLQIEDITFQAFELYTLKGENPKKVAKFLNIPVGMVYVAKTRAIQRLQRIVKELQEG